MPVILLPFIFLSIAGLYISIRGFSTDKVTAISIAIFCCLIVVGQIGIFNSYRLSFRRQYGFRDNCLIIMDTERDDVALRPQDLENTEVGEKKIFFQARNVSYVIDLDFAEDFDSFKQDFVKFINT